jgi:O-antigen ligase
MRTVAFWLSLILIFVTAWENMVFLEGLGTVSRATGFLVAAFWVVKVVVTGRFRKPHPFHVAVFLFVLWNVVSAFWSFGIEETIQRIKTYFQLASMAWILWDLYTTPAALKAGLQAYVLGAYVSIGSTVVNYLMGQEANYLRYAATGFNANDLGLVLALGIPVAWHLAVSESSSKVTHGLRLVNYTYIPAATLAILLTASRGALLAALPALLFVLGSLPRLNLFLRVLISAALISALFALQTLVPQSSFQRLGTIGASIAEGDLGDRVDIWRESIASSAEHPLLGVGSGAFRTAVVPGNVAHNSFLSVLTEVGIVGFILFVIILAMTVYQAMHQPRWDARLWLTMLLVWAVGASSLTWEHKKPTWLFLSLVIASAGLSVRHNEARVRSESPHVGAAKPA